MKAATRFVLVPALVLCAALTAAADSSRAGEEPLVLFPGATADGGGKTAEAAPPLGATAASPVAAPAGPAGVEDEATSAPAEAAVTETAAGSAAIGTPTVYGAPENRKQETQADGPLGGSRLLRVLAETAKPAASPEGGAARASGAAPLSGTRVSGTSVFAAEGCPRALLRRLLAGAAGEADALSALGIEREILTLCRERQEILVGLFEAEAALRELSAVPSAMPAAAEKAAVAPPLPAPPGQIVRAAQTAAPSPLRAALAATDGKSDEAVPKAPRYAWFSIIGTAGALRAGITDGSGVWFVREGDALPGGAKIAAIAGRPPAVRIAGGEKGEATPLPYRARPGDAP